MEMHLIYGPEAPEAEGGSTVKQSPNSGGIQAEVHVVDMKSGMQVGDAMNCKSGARRAPDSHLRL